MSLLKPCIDCGELSDKARCEIHRPKAFPKESAHKRGYDYAWFQLSRRARKLQPFCSIPGCKDKDLTGDHSPEAWERKANGLPIRLQDIDVLCRTHNAAKGQAKPEGWQ